MRSEEWGVKSEGSTILAPRIHFLSTEWRREKTLSGLIKIKRST